MCKETHMGKKSLIIPCHTDKRCFNLIFVPTYGGGMEIFMKKILLAVLAVIVIAAGITSYAFKDEINGLFTYDRKVIKVSKTVMKKISKEILENEYFDTARTGIRGAGVHGHSLRLDENGLMFDMLRRQVLNKETGNVEMVKDQIGHELDEPVVLGEPLDEETLRAKTTIYRCDGEAYKDDEDAVTVLRQIHVTRSQFGYNPEY